MFCLPALALLTGAGLARLSPAREAIALSLIAALGLPVQLAERQPNGHSDNIRAAAAVLAQHERPGDGVLYNCPACNFQDMPREYAYAYPAAFSRLDDLAQAESPVASGTLRGTEVSLATLDRRLQGVSRVWLVETGGPSVPAALTDSGLHRVALSHADDITVALYER